MQAGGSPGHEPKPANSMQHFPLQGPMFPNSDGGYSGPDHLPVEPVPVEHFIPFILHYFGICLWVYCGEQGVAQFNRVPVRGDKMV